MGVGGVDDSQQKLQLAQNQKTLELIERQTQRASRDVGKLFGSAEQNLLAGNQAAMGLMGQYAPEQFGALQQGNLNAQQQLLAGMPQVQNALLGLPTDLSGFQPRTFTPNLSFLQQQMPQFQTSADALQRNTQEQAQERMFSNQASLAGLPTFTKQDFNIGGMDEMAAKQIELQKALQGLTPEAFALLKERGPEALGLGGSRGTALYNQAVGSGYDARGQGLRPQDIPDQRAVARAMRGAF